MGNKCKRFLTMLLMAVLLVSALCMNVLAAETDTTETTTELECYVFGDVNGDDVIDQKDAIYLLYRATLGEEMYPLNGRDGDMDGDGDIDKDDAIRLLFHTFPAFAQSYPLAKEGTIHAYFAPVWTWNETAGETKCMAATVTVKCACGQEHTGTVDAYPDAKAATCTEDGYEKYRETITVGGIDYVGTYEVVLPATGHNVTATCTGEAACQNGCGYTVAALGHSWDEISKTDATCGVDGKKVSKCSVCSEEKTDVIPATGKHTYGDEVVVPVEDKACTFEKVKSCSCGHKISSGEYEEHSYTDKVAVTHATCITAGQKVYTCDNCTSTKAEEIPVNPEAHDWQTTDNSHFTCACGAEKDVVNVENNADVATDTLAQNELALAEGTALSLDGDSVENLPAEQVQVSVENVAEEGETPVYDFNMTYVDENGETQPVSVFEGTVTVTLPYELGDDEDPESVAVLYINGDGETETIYATYANGYITFTTNHFSYYTVTRLSPAERCALYGHKYGIMPLTKEATCTEGGYTYKVCQRCAHVDVVSTTEAKGHSYERTTTAATCVEAGKHTDVCSVCNHTVVTEIPAIGHAYEKQTAESVDPKCLTSGKNVYKCGHCGDSYEEIVGALGHDFGEIETKSATCEENGYQKHTCGRCGHEETLAEYSAKGHRFPTSDEEDAEVKPEWDWVWEDEDLIDVTVVIHCVEEGCTYTKTLTAVVTEEDNTGCEGGDVTYYAQAGYNGHGFEHPPYKKHKEGEGHKHGDKWHNDAVKHYHKCSTCKEMFDSAAHNWDEGTVISEATCVDKGETIYKCTVCGYEKKETVPATGKHDLQNGVCADCGYKANDCTHIRSKEIRLDLSEHGACGGWVQISTCECGENAYPWDWSLDCEFEEKEEERTSEEGVKYTVVTSTCKECGLTFENYGYEYCTEDPCEAGYCYGSKFTIDGEVIVDGETSGIYESHPIGWGTERETVDLTELGLCNEILTKETCPCGERNRHYGESRCNWEYLEGSIFEDTGVTEICTNCGAKRNRLDSEIIDEANCAYVFTQKYTYYVNDKEVYSYSNIEQHEWHIYTHTNFKLMGDSCEDGVTFDVVCMNCGETGYGYESWHIPVNTKIMDLSAYDICCDIAYQSTCICELAYRDGGLESGPDGSYCQWERIAGPGMSGIGGPAFVDQCSVCGATLSQYYMDAVVENCLIRETRKFDLADKNGKHIVTYYHDEFHEGHAYEETYTLLGDSCEDGVQITRTCINCGHSYTSTEYWHNARVVETVDVSALGGCLDHIEHYSCACGENAGLWYHYGNNGGGFDWVEGSQSHEVSECRYCGIRREVRWEEEAIDSCHAKVNYTVTFSKDGKSKTISYEIKEENHEIVYELKLKDGATDCNGGYTIAEICQKCDYRKAHGTDYGHNAHVIAKKNLSNGQLCGELYEETIQCACGLESWTNTRWANGECDFNWYYSEELGREVNECATCHAIRHFEETVTPIAGTCDVNVARRTVYLKDGKELFSYDENWTDTRHGWVYDFKLKGEDCNAGYDYTATCKYCGATDSGTNCYGHRSHETWTKIAEQENVCSTFSLVTYQCACGECNFGWNWTSECTFSWQYDEALGRDVNKCTKCGLAWTDTEGHTGTSDPCVWDTNRNYNFYLKGKELGSHTSTYKSNHHSYVYDFTLYGTTCDDGYTYTATCKFCGDYMESNGIRYGCGWYMMDQIMLYGGENACGAVVYFSDGCACGKLKNNWTEHSCNFGSYWDEKLGRHVNKCSDCDLIWMIDETTGEPDENCDVTSSKVHTFMLNGVVVGTYSNVSTEKQHDWRYEFNLLGETCEDGYTRNRVCQRCDMRDESEEIRYDHNGWRTGEIEVHNGEGEGICGRMVLYTISCACGRYQDFEWSYNCDFGGYWDDKLQCEVFECENCDLNYIRKEVRGKTDENCDYTVTYDYTFKLGDQVIKTCSYTTTKKDHNWTREFTLLGEHCDDGYTMNSVCTRCGERDDSDYVRYGCEHWSMGDAQMIYENENLCGPIYVESSRCACGLISDYFILPTCNTHEYWDNKLSSWVNECADCGLKYYGSNKYLGKGENCVNLHQNTYTFEIGEETFEYSYNYQNPEHSWIYTYEIVDGANTCDAGYYRNQICAKCGYKGGREGIYYGHETNRVEYYDLADYGLCGGYISVYSCACGQNAYVNSSQYCDYHYTGKTDEDTGARERYCDTCGNYTYYLSESEYVRKNCRSEGKLYFEVRNEETPLVVQKEFYQTLHTYVATEMTLTGTSGSCDDGYKVKQECLYCDAFIESWGSDHDRYPIKFIDLSEAGSSCGGYLEQRSCACGQHKNFDYSPGMDWDGERTQIDENGVYHTYDEGHCNNCDLKVTEHRYTELDEGSCDGTYYRYYTFTLGDAVNETLVESYRTTSHNWTYEFHLQGQFCKDGYTRDSVCTRCGQRNESDEVHYGCSSSEMGDEQVIHNGEGICGIITAESYRCACGSHAGVSIRTGCNTGEYWDDELNCWVQKCNDCGLMYYIDDEFVGEDENCINQYQRTYTFYIGEESFTYSYIRKQMEHNWVYSYEMVEGATSCEDGYYRIRICNDCGYEAGREGIYHSHDTNCVEYYNLADYGLCGGYINVNSCACGAYKDVHCYEPCNEQQTGNVDKVTGATEYYCADCNTYTYYLNRSEYNRQECRNEGRFYYQAIRDSETLVTVDRTTGNVHHSFVVKDYALNEGAADCEGGWTGRYECYYCGYGYEISGEDHNQQCVKYIDLAEYGLCDSAHYLEQRSCACGEHQDFSYDVCDNFSWYNNWTEDDEKGNEHYYEVGKCDECGLEILWHQYVDLEDGSCDGTFYRYYTVTMGDALNETLVRCYPDTKHDWGEPVYALEEGSEVCTDGVSRTYYCQREGCGATSYTGFTPSGHYYMNVTKSIDLAQYGSICGEKLIYMECPCGAEYRWSFDEENHCDLDQKSTDRDWLTEVIERNNLGEKLVHDSQNTTEGYIYSHSYAYIFTCAVTDPEACGLKVRMAEYWVKNGCEVTEYQTWQLGYDADTGTWQHEITVATGDKHAYHDYEYSDADEYDENGNYTLEVDLDLCPDCGSYFKRKYFYDNGDHIKTEYERVNTLNNGENKRYYELYEYGEEQTYEHNGETGSFRYQTLSRDEYTYADGSEYWYQNAYTYNFQDTCMRSYVYTDSNGGYDSDTDTCHNTYYSREDIEQPTCTQYGSYRYWYTCYVCGEITSEYTGSYSPVAHYWYWNEDLQTYVCSVCELENINGASGVVVMEDLTDDENWGSDTDYVIGYWNRENVQFTVELSVIFNDRDEEHEDGNQFVLTGIEIADHTKENDGFVGKSFNKEAAIAAAEAKMEEQGYTGSFSIRINFVPVNDETDLDYAITFDPIGAAA